MGRARRSGREAERCECCADRPGLRWIGRLSNQEGSEAFKETGQKLASFLGRTDTESRRLDGSEPVVEYGWGPVFEDLLDRVVSR